MKSLDDLGDLRGKRVVVRCDLNVPLDENRQITDDGRIRASLPTISALREKGAKVVVLAHLGRPKGEVNPKFSLAPAAQRLGELLGTEVRLATDVVGESAQALVAGLADGDVMMCENVRYEKAEESKDDAERAALARRYAALGDCYVSNGFGVVHRKQASVYDIARELPSAMGDLVKTEVDVLKRLTDDPERPYVVVLGGAKVADKLAVIDNLLGVADTLVIGGGMLFTFLAAQGLQTGDSLVDADSIETCRTYLAEAEKAGKKILLPVDVRVAPGLDFSTMQVQGEVEVVKADAIPAGTMGLDIGPESERLFADEIRKGKTVFWNGPMGVFEVPELAGGTKAVAQALTEVDGLSVVGGGDSAAAVRTLGFADDQFGHISTGGGASLEYLEGKQLPGLTIMEESK